MTILTKRILLIGTLLLLYLLSKSFVFLVLSALFLILMGLERIAAFNLSIRRLFEHRGPRTDVRYMTREELFSSGRSFLVGGGALAILIMAGVKVISMISSSSPEFPFVFGIFFVLLILNGCLLLGGVYLLIRGLFRSRSYDPYSVYLLDFLENENRD